MLWRSRTGPWHSQLVLCRPCLVSNSVAHSHTRTKDSLSLYRNNLTTRAYSRGVTVNLHESEFCIYAVTTKVAIQNNDQFRLFSQTELLFLQGKTFQPKYNTETKILQSATKLLQITEWLPWFYFTSFDLIGFYLIRIIQSRTFNSQYVLESAVEKCVFANFGSMRLKVPSREQKVSAVVYTVSSLSKCQGYPSIAYLFSAKFSVLRHLRQ